MPEEFDYGRRRDDGQFERHPTIRTGQYVRRYRDSYLHTVCGNRTDLSEAIAKTFARDPQFYSRTFCVACAIYCDVSEFEWIEKDGTPGPSVGS